MKIPPPVFLLLALLIPLSACQTPREFAAPAAGWRTYQGQLRYLGGEKPVIGETIVRNGGGGNFQAEFLAGPGFPLMRMRSDGTSGFAEGILARGRWQGPLNRTPDRIAAWFLLPQVFAKAEKQSGKLSGLGWEATADRTGGRITRLDVRMTGSGDRFTFVFGA